jgi:hypothetical protein
MWLYPQEFNVEDYFGFVYVITNLEPIKNILVRNFSIIPKNSHH